MKNVIVVGSLNMDLVITTPYIPKKGETMHGSNFFINPGGKGANQAVAASKLGANVSMIGCVGNDDFGNILINNLNKYNVNTKYVVKTDEASTGVADILISDGDNRIILDSGANYYLTKEDVKTGLDELSNPGDIVVLQLEIPLEVVEYTIKYAKEKQMTVMFNPAPAQKLSKELLKYIDILVVNETEAEVLLEESNLKNFKKALLEFRDIGILNPIITLGENGSIAFENEEIIKQKIFKTNVIDTTAAGDTFLGAIVSKVSNNITLKESMEFASCASSFTVSRKGAMSSIPTYIEVESYLKGKKTND